MTRAVADTYPLVRKGRTLYMALIVGHRLSTARLKSLCCMRTSGSRLRRRAVTVAAATAVIATAAVPSSTGCTMNCMTAVQQCVRFPQRLCCLLIW